ncbi:MAG: nucleotidyltransferase [Oscillospiraceae bacterium]|nr:nucleotidyltransferase [Oscillospiraceae bacterium]
MSKNPVLVVMAAGMGSRYGGLKQIDPVGCQGEAILDFSLFDAYEAGFRTAVIIIKEAIRKDFMDTVGARLKNCPMEIRYACQEQDKLLPEGMTVPQERGAKPWGTGHAVLCAREAIDGAPFAVINADDYYGKSAYRTIYNALLGAEDTDKANYCMVGYYLRNTVSDHGSVARGVCEVSGEGYLTAIVERLKIEKQPDAIRFTEDGENWTELHPDTLVSMNMFGFTPSLLDALAERFPVFLKEELPQNPAKKEFLLPMIVGDLLKEDVARVKVLSSADKWYGVTYAADKPLVVAALKAFTEQGLYPNGLWK